MTPVATLPDRLREIRKQVRTSYLQPDGRPWIIGFSGGKDSTLLLHLVVEMLQALRPSKRTRAIHVISNDTRVESPIYQEFVEATLTKLARFMHSNRLPVEVHTTAAPDEESFWVLLLGKGYPAPNRTFRWCTDRLKIRTTTRFIRERVDADGEAVLLLGVRRAESSARAARIDHYDESAVDGGLLSPHNDIPGCFIFRPIVDLSDDDVWHVLLNAFSPWGGDYQDLIALYRDAQGGECPFVTSEADAPGCGSKSPRFGCWTCTVVQKDASLEGLIGSGHEGLEPLADFRERLKSVSAMPEHRSTVRRNGRPGRGPLLIESRKMLLRELLDLQEEVAMDLISDREIRLIEDWWSRDAAEAAAKTLPNTTAK